jgi:NADH:ubiquinone oxidoreductase subunit 6 (subunit J)
MSDESPKTSNLKIYTLIILGIFIIIIIIYLFVTASQDTDDDEDSSSNQGFSITSYILGGILILCIIAIFYLSYDFQGSNLTLTMVISAILISIFIFVIIYASRETSEDNDSSLKGFSVAVIVLASLCIIAIIVFCYYKFSPSEGEQFKILEKEESDTKEIVDSLQKDLDKVNDELEFFSLKVQIKEANEKDKMEKRNSIDKIKKQIKEKEETIQKIKNKMKGIEEPELSLNPIFPSLV